MNEVKAVSKAFNILCILVRIISMIIISISWKNITIFPILSLIMCFITIIIATSAINSLDINGKSVAIGVLDLLFVSIIGGIYYLCWNPNINLQNNSGGYFNNSPQNNNNETTVLTQNDNQNHCDNTIQHSDTTVTDGRYCRYCGHKIPADASFCAYCGKNQSENNN